MKSFKQYITETKYPPPPGKRPFYSRPNPTHLRPVDGYDPYGPIDPPPGARRPWWADWARRKPIMSNAWKEFQNLIGGSFGLK